MLKNSHFVAPRTLDQCQFVPGYRPALPRDVWAEAGHLLLGAVSAAGLVVALALVIVGAL